MDRECQPHRAIFPQAVVRRSAPRALPPRPEGRGFPRTLVTPPRGVTPALDATLVAQVEIDAHAVGSAVVVLDMIRVPRTLGRRQGRGRAAYEAWERALLATVTRVDCWVADTDGLGRPFGFWDAMGFEYKYDGDEGTLGYEAAGWMWKGVNGHATPRAIAG